MQGDDVAGAPVPVDRRVAALDLKRERLAVDRRRRPAGPARHAQLQVEIDRFFGIDRDLDVAGPRVIAFLPQRDADAADGRGRLEAAVEMKGDARFACRRARSRRPRRRGARRSSCSRGRRATPSADAGRGSRAGWRRSSGFPRATGRSSAPL